MAEAARPLWRSLWDLVAFTLRTLREPRAPIPPAARVYDRDGEQVAGVYTRAVQPGCPARHVCVHPECDCTSLEGCDGG